MILLWGVLCVVILWVNGRKYENLMQFNTSWLASLRAWYYFRFYFSFSCSGYDVTLIKKSHTLNCYLFLQKLQTYKLVVGVAEFTAKTINSDIAFYFLSLMSYSINKLKFHMLFTFKNFVFWFYVDKTFLLQEMVGVLYLDFYFIPR